MNRKTIFVDVLLPLALPNAYTYRVPLELNDWAQEGVRALVPFGKNKFYTALIKRVHENPPQAYEAKYVEEILDSKPIVNPIQFSFWDWISAYYLCTVGEVMSAALPSGLKLSSETKLMLNDAIDFEKENIKELSDKEYLLLEAIQIRKVLSYSEASEIVNLKNPQSIIRQLLIKSYLSLNEEIKERYKPKIISYVKLHDAYQNNDQALQQVFEQLERKAFKQLELLLFYLKNADDEKTQHATRWVKRSTLLAHFDSTVINALIKKEIFVQQDFEIGRLEESSATQLPKKLSSAQQKALDEIQDAFTSKEIVLLHGLTGSGKTEVYCSLIEQALAQGKQVLYLLPEIALTTQLVGRIKRYFGDRAGVYHSRFSENERVEVWNAVLPPDKKDNSFNQQQHHIVIGARSALFLPFNNLGLIIVDEEHDTSYKQYDPAPRYHARDAALYLASLHGAKVLLGTATPSIESYYLAQQKKYGLVELKERYGAVALPAIELIDIRAEEKGKEEVISNTLYEKIKKSLDKKEQVILFQNRRGFAPYTECFACKHIPHCVQCDVSLIYHKATQKLTCHYCGYTTIPPKTCAACGSPDLRYRGFGTQKIEEEIELLFPQAKVKRMDVDATRSKHAHKQIIDAFDNQEIDILVGTQMLSKGLDFDNVALVGILQADHLLGYPDFRAHEKAFQLMMQVSGRAGRKKQGTVLIQTTQPQNPVLSWVLNNDYQKMYQHLLAERQEHLYPPFARLFSFVFIHKDIDLLTHACDWFATQMRAVFSQRVLGPQSPLVSKVKNEYYKQVLLKVERSYSANTTRQLVQKILFDFRTDKLLSKVRVKIDVDFY
ncbi:MAG: primosomal protein N' [Bacteroidetes bacterium]|nr:primosomal protein N' [Bacteroidota bacterium]